MTFNHSAGLRILFHEVGQGFDIAVAFLLDLGLVEVELDVQFDTNGFGRLGNGNFLDNNFFDNGNLLRFGTVYPAVGSGHTGTHECTTTCPGRAFDRP